MLGDNIYGQHFRKVDCRFVEIKPLFLGIMLKILNASEL